MTLITQKSGKDGEGKNAKVNRSTGDDYEGSPLSMTGIRTGLLNRTITKVVLGLLIVIFAFTFLLAGVGGGPTNPDGSPQSNDANRGPIARVAEQEISRSEFRNALEQQLRFATMFGQNPGPAEMLMLQQQTLQGLSDQAAQIAAARAAGITASGAEIDAKIHKLIDDQIKQERDASPADFRRRIESQYSSEKAYHDEMLGNIDRDAVEKQLLLEKFEQSVKDANRVTEDDYKRSVTKVLLRQIVVRPKAPAPTEKDFKAAQDKSVAAARAKAEKFAAQLKAAAPTVLAATFVNLAKTQSDDTISKAKGGLLGWKMPSEILGAVALKDAVANATGSLVGPIQDENSREFYIYHIGGRKLELPKDYAKKKAQYLKDFETQRDNEVLARRQEEIKKATQPEILDPALQAYRIQTQQVFAAPADQQNALRQEALNKYQEALKNANGTEAAAIHYQMAQLHQALNQPDKRIASLQAALKESSDATVIRIELARALRESKKPKEALEALNAASKELASQPAAAPSPMGGGSPTAGMHMQLSMEYEQLGRKDLAAKERQLAMPQGAPGMGGMPPGMGGSPNSLTIPGSR